MYETFNSKLFRQYQECSEYSSIIGFEIYLLNCYVAIAILTVDGTIVKLKKMLQLSFLGSDRSFRIALRGLNDSLTAITK